MHFRPNSTIYWANPPPLEDYIFSFFPWYAKIYSSCTLFGFIFALFLRLFCLGNFNIHFSSVFSPFSFIFSSFFHSTFSYFPQKWHPLIFFFQYTPPKKCLLVTSSNAYSQVKYCSLPKRVLFPALPPLHPFNLFPGIQYNCTQD